MTVVLEPQTYVISADDVELVSIDYTEHLDGAEVLTGTPTVTESSGNATLANKQVSSATYVDKDSGDTVAIGKAVQFSFTSATAATYTITITVSTDASIARTFKRNIVLTVD